MSKDTAGKREAWELALATSKEERSDCYVDWPAALLEQIRIQQAWGSIFWDLFRKDFVEMLERFLVADFAGVRQFLN